MMPLYPVALLSGGLATRLRPMTEKTPKALLPIHGEPFICHQLRLLKRQGVTRVVLCIGFLGDMIVKAVGDGSLFGLDVQYVFDGPNLLGTAGALKKALPLLGEHFFVLYGDSYLPCDLLSIQKAYQHSQQQALMTVYHNQGAWDNSNVAFEKGIIRTYDKLNRSAAMQHIDYGLGVFNTRAFTAVPDNKPHDLAALYQLLLQQQQLAACEVSERFYEIGSTTGISEFTQYIKGEHVY
ncbi:MAG: sugar phosphate nucleotidyltransferase [Legionellales bacterium]